MPQDFNSFASYLQPFDSDLSRLPPIPIPQDVQASGTGNWLTAGVMSGLHGAVSQGARALQAGAQLLGAPETAQTFADYAEAAHAREQSYARRDLEENPWSLPGIGYQIARMVPMGAAALGGGLAATAAAPESAIAGAAGAALPMFLPAAGENAQRQISETGELTSPGKALLLGAPEAIVQGYLPGRLEKFFGKGIIHGIAGAAATQAGAAGATEFMTQQLGNPDRTFADRASAIGSAALSGAAIGGIMGGAFGGMRALVGKPAQEVTPDALKGAVDQVIDPKSVPDAKSVADVKQADAPSPKAPPGSELQEPSVSGGKPENVPAAEAPSVLTSVTPEQAELPPPVSEGLEQLPVLSKQEEVPSGESSAVGPIGDARVDAGVVGAEPGAAPSIDFTGKFSERVFKEGVAQFEAATPEAQVAMRQQLIDTFLERGDKKPTKVLKKWGEALDILDEKGELRNEFIPDKPVEIPPGVEPEAPVVPPTPVAEAAPIMTAEGRVAALSGLQEAIAKLPESEAKAQHAEAADIITQMLARAENNPGLLPKVDDRIENLKAAVTAEATLPPDAIASTPSPRAEAVPVSMGDMNETLTNAQTALGGLRKALEGRSDVTAVLDQHEKWLADIRKAASPDELRTALAADPEADINGNTLENLGQLSRSQRGQINRYLAEQEGVLQELRAQTDSRARTITSRDGLPVTQLDADVTSLHQRGATMADVADHIIEHTSDPEQAEIVAKIKPFLPEGAKTLFRDGVADKEGEYFPKQQTSALYNAADATMTSIHEMVHAVTHKALEGAGVAAKAMHGIFDQLVDTGNHEGITDTHEMVSEAFANPTYRDFLRTQFVKGTSLWDRLVDTVRQTIGLDPRMFNALDRIMSLGDDLMKENTAYPNEWMGPDSYARQANRGTKTASGAADAGDASLRQKLDDGLLNVKAFMRSLGLGWNNGYWLARSDVYNKLSPNIPEFVKALGAEDPRRQWLGRAAIVADRQGKTLPEEGQALLNKVMAAATSFGFHPDRARADYSEIHGDPAQVQRFDIVKDLWNQLGQIPGGREAFNTYRDMMSAYGGMSALHNLQTVERAIPGLSTGDFFREMDSRTDLHNQPRQLNAEVQKEFDARIKADAQFRNQLSAQKSVIDQEIAKKPATDQLQVLAKQRGELESQIDQLDSALREAKDRQNQIQREPYFHLGRDGDYFVTGKLVTVPDETGALRVNQDLLSKFADHLERNKINTVDIMQGGESGTFYARVQSPAQAASLARILTDAQAKGLMAKEAIGQGRDMDSTVFNRVASAAMQDILARVRETSPLIPDGASPETIEALNASHGVQIKNLQRALLNMTPETSMARLLSQRMNVHGFDRDMMQSQARAADMMSSGIARQSLQHEVSAAEGGMLADVTKVNNTPEMADANTRFGLSDVVAELMRQQRSRQTFVPRSPMEAIRNLTNVLALGMSPAYVTMQLGQLGITGLPELAKTHGYGSSFGAITGVLPEALKVTRAIALGGEGLTAGITQEALEKAGLSATLTKKIMGMVSRGTLGSTYTSAATEHTPTIGKRSDTVLKAANTLGMYADLVPRIVMGLAADRLYEAKPQEGISREAFVDRAITESQGYYGSALGARNTSRSGIAGPLTPVFTQFMQWNIHMTNKIYHEVSDAFSGDAKAQKEARTWLKGHAAAVAILSGTLGLPAVSVAASVYDKLAGWADNRDDHNITTSYRNFLASTFGKDIGEIIARGLPRAAGMDFAHWGEGEIIPGSSALNTFLEKRKFEDMKSDWFKGVGGPAFNQLFQIADAAGDIMNGDYLEGLIKLSPGLGRGAGRAYKLTDEGFTDSHGQKLPLTASTWDIVQTVLGLTPGKKAEYQEVAKNASGMRAMRMARSSDIEQHLRSAYTQGDHAAFQTWMGEARQWQAEHPGLVPPQASFSRALANHQRQVEQARGLGLPIGVTPQDLGTRRALGYANLPEQ